MSADDIDDELFEAMQGWGDEEQGHFDDNYDDCIMIGGASPN